MHFSTTILLSTSRVLNFPFHHNCEDKSPPDLPKAPTKAACNFILMCFTNRLLFKNLCSSG